jgi:phage terminase large subunit-like protein
MPTDAAWNQARSKLIEWAGVAEKLGPEDSVASFMVQRAASREGILRLFGSMSDPEVESLVFDLDFWARRQQIPPRGLWETCITLAGRGFGKTWMGARWVHTKAKEGKTIGALVGPTAADVRDTMIRGSSGILALAPPWFMPVYEPSKRRITWPNGVYALCYSADKPDRLRGPNTGWVWGDEPASWKHEMAALDQIPLFNRIGSRERPPQTLLTGTPRPLKKLEALIQKPSSILVTGSSLANAANLAPTTVANMKNLAGTRWGKQEVLGQLLMDVPGAIFGSAKWGRVDADPVVYGSKLDRRIVAVDPAPTSETGSDEWGIVVEGVKHAALLSADGLPLKKVSILADRSVHGSPREGAATAIKACIEFGCSDIVVEVNSGGEMVETIISTVAGEMGVTINVKPVRAREQKSKRAEPVSALAEAGRIEFVGPICDDGEGPRTFPKLEKQLEKFTGINGRRDDRADAMCWGVHDLVFADQFFAIF